MYCLSHFPSLSIPDPCPRPPRGPGSPAWHTGTPTRPCVRASVRPCVMHPRWMFDVVPRHSLLADLPQPRSFRAVRAPLMHSPSSTRHSPQVHVRREPRVPGVHHGLHALRPRRRRVGDPRQRSPEGAWYFLNRLLALDPGRYCGTNDTPRPAASKRDEGRRAADDAAPKCHERRKATTTGTGNHPLRSLSKSLLCLLCCLMRIPVLRDFKRLL